MIPPSIVLIMYGLITETSIHALFKGAFVPGLILGASYILYIIVRTRLNPELAPLPEPSDDDIDPAAKRNYLITLLTWMVGIWGGFALLHALMIEAQNAFGLLKPDDYQPYDTGQLAQYAAMFAAGFFLPPIVFGVEAARATWVLSKGLIAPLIVVMVVLGSIYGGVTGITEAAGMGTVAVLFLITIRGELSFALVRDALMRTFRSTGTIIWVTFGATALAGAYTIAGGPTYVANLIVGAELPTLSILLVMMVIFLFLGAFMDWVGIVLLIMPVFLPIVLKLPVEEIGLLAPLVSDPRFVPVWFGILFCVNMQVSFLSPPFGPAAFYLKSVAPPEITLPAIFRSFMPFMLIQLVILMLILFFPELTMVFR
jgi:TRAP-type mannitol/chloroaromatic compound transport system permease large subunit